ncbi:hypothetical protein [Enterococcus phage vB_Efs25_KEN11]
MDIERDKHIRVSFAMEVLGLPDCKISTVLKAGYKIII